MATITSLGVGSGLDLNTMLTQLVAIERKPIEQMQTEAKRMQTQVSTLGQMTSLLSTLRDAATALTSTTLWRRSTATSSNEAAVSTVGGSTAAAGNYAVRVGSLASPQTAVSTSGWTSATELVGSGTLTLEVGAWDAGNTAFTPKSGTTAVTLTVTATDTLQSLRDKINALGAGVTASVVTDANGTRLALRSSASGVDNGFRVTAADDDGNGTDAAGLSRAVFDPPSGATSMALAQPGTNATATVNGVFIVSASNDLTGVVEGMTLRLRQVTDPASVDIAVAADTAAVKEAVQKFADAYNALATAIADNTKYDPATKIGGVLQGDSTVTGLLGRLRGVLNESSGASGAFGRLSDLGLQLQRDGTLKIDSARLDTALANLPEMRKALSNTDALVPANNGFMRRFVTLATDVLGVDGSLTTRTAGLRAQITRNGEKQERLEARVERFRERLTAQFTAMDANLSRLNALQAYVTQQIAALQKSNNSNN